MFTMLEFANPTWWHVAGWTMIHFLWIGTVVGAVAAVCRLLLRRAPPNVRYVTALVFLVLLTALPIGLAAWLAGTGPAPQVAAADGRGAGFEIWSEERGAGNEDEGVDNVWVSGAVNRPAVIELATQKASLATTDVSANPNILDVESTLAAAAIQPAYELRWISQLDLAVRYLPWLWIIGSPLTFALLATGLVGTRRLRGESTPVTSGPLLDACSRLVHSLRIRRQVAIAICERIAAPVLVGILWPAILLPPAALTGWSPADLEMVLLHELAHVRRWDNLVNLLQRCFESLLFFHPTVWLVSRETMADHSA